MLPTSKNHWPEYLIEAAGLGIFMMSACLFSVLLFHPSSPVVSQIESAGLRRALMGVAMGLTGVTLVTSPWGKRSGAHFNPAVSLTFFRLGKISGIDTLYYTLCQFLGGLAGVSTVAFFLHAFLSHPSISYAITKPGDKGSVVAFFVELAMAAVTMFTVLMASNSARFMRWTGFLVGGLVALYITLAAPLSGMSMNPARSFASSVFAGDWMYLWVYFTAPIIGMFGGAEIYLQLCGAQRLACAKLIHDNKYRCVFCGYEPAKEGV